MTLVQTRQLDLESAKVNAGPMHCVSDNLLAHCRRHWSWHIVGVIVGLSHVLGTHPSTISAATKVLGI